MKGSGFASIYSQWTDSHDERAEIEIRNGAENLLSKKTYTIKELRRMKIQDELDLHSYTLDEAMKQLRSFIRESIESGYKKVRIITGKGLHSPDGVAVLRPAVISALQADKCVRDMDSNPKPQDGGSGAIIVLLK